MKEEEEDVDATGRFILTGCFRPSNEEIERRGVKEEGTLDGKTAVKAI